MTKEKLIQCLSTIDSHFGKKQDEVTNNLWWWEWILPEIQEEYSRALNASTGERRNE